jgi:signal transduction histidine kinase
MRITVVCRCLIAAAIAVGPVLSAREQVLPLKRVLIIQGGPEGLFSNPEFDARIRQVLNADVAVQVETYSEYLENEEFGDTASTALSEYIRLKYRDLRFDLVMANTAPALGFVLRYRDELFPDLPVVFAVAALPAAIVQGRVPRVTGIVRDPSLTETVELMLRIHPGTKRIHVISYAPAIEGFDQRTRAALAPFTKRVTVTYSTEPTLPEMLATLRTLPADSLVIGNRYTPPHGRTIFPELIPAVSVASPVPFYATLDSQVGDGVVGGMMRSADSTARRLGEMAVQVLNGAVPESIPIEPTPLHPIFDWRQLQRWGIDESQLPEGSEIRFRVPTSWELYGPYISATAVVVSAQLLLIAGLLRQRARLRRADNIIRSREASLRTSYNRIRHMAGRLINAQEAARADIARDLHDDVSQKLAYVSVSVNGLRNATGNIQDPQTQEAFEELERETRNTFEGIRRLSHDLHPATLRLLGLAPALRSHCNEVAKRQGVEVTFSSGGSVGTVHPEVAVCFFRIAQESLRNGISHGGAKHLEVTLERTGDRLELTVTDDGQGFDVSAIQGSGGGIGLVTMEERANFVGGSVSISSRVGHGTTVRVTGPADLPAAAGPVSP